MKVDEWTSEDGHTSGGGEYPPCAGLTSNVIPEAYGSYTGVSVENVLQSTQSTLQNSHD